MSAAKTILITALISLGLLGVLAALAETAREKAKVPPTELYVRTDPSGAKVFVDDKERGTSPSLLEVEPGDHTVTVKLDGHQPRTKTVTLREGRIRRVILGFGKGPATGGAATDSASPPAKPRGVKLFHADRVREKGVPAVLDLASGKLIAQPKTADDAAIAKHWDQLGRGDLAYPGEGLMVLRRGTVEQWNPTTRQYEPAKAVYQEPRGATKPLVTGYALENLPLRFRITTGDGKTFDVTVLEKKPNGDYIEIEYRPSSESEDRATTGGKGAPAAAEPRNETPEALAKTVVECLRKRDWVALMRRTVVSDEEWKPLQERIRRAVLSGVGGNPLDLDLDTPKSSHAEEILQDWRRFVERGERDFDIDWTRAEYECAEYKIVEFVGTSKLDFVFSAGGKHYRASIDDVVLTNRGWLAADGPRLVGQLDKPMISVPVETKFVEQNVAQDGWGEPVDGVECRVRAEKPTWPQGTVPKLLADLRNRGKRNLRIALEHESWEIEIDGTWHQPNTSFSGDRNYLPLGPSAEQQNLEVWIAPADNLGRQLRALEPGKHTLRVARLLNSTRAPGEEILRLVSNPIEIEIVPAEAAADPVALPPPQLSPRKLFSASHGADAGILAVAFSPDGLRVAAVDEQGKVMLCDARSGAQLWGRPVLTPEEKKRLLYEDRQGRIHTASIAFSHDGYTLAVAADPVVRLYDAQSGRLQRALEDKKLIEALEELNRPPATISRELELLKAVPHAHGRVYSVAFSPDGRWLATSGSHLIRADGSSVISSEVATRGKLKLWDAKTGELTQDLGEHFGALRSVAFSPDGETLASIGSHPPSWTRSVRLWDPETGAVKTVLPFAQGGGPEGPVTFSPDGKLLAASAFIREADPDNPGSLRGLPGCNLMVWNARTGEQLFNHRTSALLTSLSFSADGRTLATGVDGEGVTLWDAETLAQKGQIQLSADPPREVQVAFSPTGSLLAVGAENERGGFVTVWEIGEPGDRTETRPPVEPVRLPAPDQRAHRR